MQSKITFFFDNIDEQTANIIMKEIGDFIDTQYPGQWSATASPLTLPPPPDGVTPEKDCVFWYDMAMSLSRQVEELKRQLKYSKLGRKKENKNR